MHILKLIGKTILSLLWMIVAEVLLNLGKVLLYLATKGTVTTIEVTSTGALRVSGYTTTRMDK